MKKRRPQTTRLKRRCLLAALFKRVFGCVRASAHTVLVEPQTSSIRFSTKDCSTKACHRTQVRQAASRVTEGDTTKSETHPKRSSSGRASRHSDANPRAQIGAKHMSRMRAKARRGEHAHPAGDEVRLSVREYSNGLGGTSGGATLPCAPRLPWHSHETAISHTSAALAPVTE